MKNFNFISTVKDKTSFDFEGFKKEAMEGLYAGKKMGGIDGVFAPMLKHLLESMLEGELEYHLEDSKASGDSNRRNGKSKKTVRSLQSGHFELESGRDRNVTFEPKIVAKRQLILIDELEDNVIPMYSKGVINRDISNYIKEMYAMDISATEIFSITDKVIPAMTEWRNRPLNPIYPFVFLDGMFYKVKESGSVTSSAVYNILGVNIDGKKDILGMYHS